jgi:hypothetical protein
MPRAISCATCGSTVTAKSSAQKFCVTCGKESRRQAMRRWLDNPENRAKERARRCRSKRIHAERQREMMAPRSNPCAMCGCPIAVHGNRKYCALCVKRRTAERAKKWRRDPEVLARELRRTRDPVFQERERERAKRKARKLRHDPATRGAYLERSRAYQRGATCRAYHRRRYHVACRDSEWRERKRKYERESARSRLALRAFRTAIRAIGELTSGTVGQGK